MGLLNSTRDKRERVGRMLLMHSNNREDIKEAYAGDIVALAGLKDTRTGDTLCDPTKSPVILERMNFPEPVIEIAVEPKSKADQEKLGVALAKMVAEDPSFTVSHRPGVGPDDPEGHGRAAPGHQGRHPEAHLQGRSQHRRAAGGLSREPQPQGRDRLHPQEADRRHGPVRPGEDGVRAGRAGLGLRVRDARRRRRGAEGIHPRRREGPELGQGKRPAGRLPGDRLQGDADRRRLPRRRLLGAGLRNRRRARPSASCARRARPSCSSRS